MKQKQIDYERVIFVCVNNANGEKPSCGDHKGEEIFRALREVAKEKGVHPRIRVTRAKCLGQCANGCAVMVYPQETCYLNVRLDDVKELSEKLL